MTRRQTVLVALGGGVILVAGFAAGFALSSGGDPSPTPSPSASALACQVSVSPTLVLVDPDTGASEDVLFFAGSGFPADEPVTITFAPLDSTFELTSTADGDLSAEVPAEAGVTHPAPPDLEAGRVTWSVAADECEDEVEVTIEFTHAPSAVPSPPTDLSAGGYAEVVADGVRVRVQPSLDATVVGALFIGDVVRILEPAQMVEGLAWYRVESVVIQSGEPVQGYVAAGADGQVFLRATTEPPPPTPSPSPSPSPSPT